MSARADLDKEPDDVAEMFDEVSPRYDVMNDLTTFGQIRVWREAVAAAVDPHPGVKILDIAAGTGTAAAIYAARGATVSACDFSHGMLAEGEQRHPELDFRWADAMDLPYDDDSFDVTTISYGLRNVHDPQKALEEMLRVTKPGGRLVVAEFSQPVNPLFRDVYYFYLSAVIPALSSLFSSDSPAYGYLIDSIRDWPRQEELATMIQQAGWRHVGYRNLCGGIVAIHRASKA